MKVSLACSSVLVLLSTLALGDFLPPNDLHLEDNLFFDGGVTEEEFHEAIDEAEEYYADVVASQGGRLAFNRNWKSSTVNASASQFFGTWNVNMYGGLARRPEVTKDGFALVVCHELGHHLGGFPFTSSWAANEGQSDYFATLSCARELWSDDIEVNELAADLIPDYPKALCDERYFADGQDRMNLCYRSMLAGNSLANLLGALRKVSVDWETPDPKTVKRTSHSHPAAQCRLDTYMAGALCDSEFDPNIIPRSEKVAASGSCHIVNGDEDGLRPRCWFSPKLGMELEE